ncbi:EVE domain-containing protein [Rheinheimera texasensis]|uniref:EVE domain-containing protein n=1 Tax=Rheinheimera texasensis TaxID=306205 RepID=UPI0004E130EE|nr:EVE domain-containing protein [Rheinheimera texasensis]
MYWVFKTEPAECSILDIQAAGPKGVVWEGVRNYQARNFLRDQVKIGDQVLIHHSSCAHVGIAGVGVILAEAYPDPSQFQPRSLYYDAKSTPEKAPWVAVQVGFVEQFSKVLSMTELRQIYGLADMQLLKKGNRLSIIPATKAEFDLVLCVAKAYSES